MAPPSFPWSSFPRNQHAAATITISSDDSGGSSVHSIVDVSSDDEATSKRKWSREDERAILATIADLHSVNGGVIPPSSAILDELRVNGALGRPGTSSRELSKKVYNMRRKFATSALKAAANGGKLKPRTKHRDKKLYEESQDVWPEMLEDGGYSYWEAKAARRSR
ncbi:unnamed protein product [Urochloa decumbens]|uniref:Glabrous enhancer-binding protein-like DBD domain-containing protein n=1 Tax=Urochloa decumbens TaxID=240449 RepID=A0ABC9D9I3_9POAL